MNVGSTSVNELTCFAGRSLKWMLSEEAQIGKRDSCLGSEPASPGQRGQLHEWTWVPLGGDRSGIQPEIRIPASVPSPLGLAGMTSRLQRYSLRALAGRFPSNRAGMAELCRFMRLTCGANEQAESRGSVI